MRFGAGQVQRGRFAQGVDQLFVDDLDHLLGGIERPGDFCPDCPFFHPADERLDHRVMHIGFQQRHPDIAHGGIDIFLRKLAVPAKFGKYCVQSFGQCFKHSRISAPGVVPSDM